MSAKRKSTRSSLRTKSSMAKLRRNFSRKFCLFHFTFQVLFCFKFSPPSRRLCLTVLKHKGHQVEKQRDEIEMLGKISRKNNAQSICMTICSTPTRSFIRHRSQIHPRADGEAEEVDYEI